MAFDAESVRRWQGHDLDLGQPLTSAAIVAAAQADPHIESKVAPFLSMGALPASLADAEPMARAVYERAGANRRPTARRATSSSRWPTGRSCACTPRRAERACAAPPAPADSAPVTRRTITKERR